MSKRLTRIQTAECTLEHILYCEDEKCLTCREQQWGDGRKALDYLVRLAKRATP